MKYPIQILALFCFILNSPLCAHKHHDGSGSGSEKSELTKWLGSRLVARDGKRVKSVNKSHISKAEYIAFYYSAAWCPPCRSFTPKLVKFYNKHRGIHDDFELVFVSSDSDQDSFEKYILDYKMPWPAVRYEDANNRKIDKYAGRGIPCLVVVDRNGKVLVDTYVNGEYMGPTYAMDRLKALLKK